MTDHSVGTDGTGGTKMLAGAGALVLGAASLFAIVLLDLGTGPIVIALAVVALALLIAGTLSIGAADMERPM